MDFRVGRKVECISNWPLLVENQKWSDLDVVETFVWSFSPKILRK